MLVNGAVKRSAWYFLAWTALGLFFFSQGLTQKHFTQDPYPWWQHFISWMLGVYVWLILTPLIVWLGRRFPLHRRHWIRAFSIQLFFSALISLTQLVVQSLILRKFGIFPGLVTSYRVAFTFLFVFTFHQCLLTYWIILGIQYAAGWYRQYQERKQETLRLQLRSSELQTQLVQAHLGTLKMQLQPHFLFNTLNSIMVLVRQQKGLEAEEMLGLLSDLLRVVLDDIEAQEVTLRREMECVRLYLSIEQVRFHDRLQVDIDTPPEILDAAVPQMILQPIVENATRHGIAQRSAPGKVRIRARRTGGLLTIAVENDGPPAQSARVHANQGIGIANTRARLQQLYGDTALFNLDYNTGGASATITLPYRLPSESATELDAIHSISS